MRSLCSLWRGSRGVLSPLKYGHILAMTCLIRDWRQQMYTFPGNKCCFPNKPQISEGPAGAGRMDNSSWSCIWSRYCRLRSGIKITVGTALVFFHLQTSKHNASSLLSRCDKQATRTSPVLLHFSTIFTSWTSSSPNISFLPKCNSAGFEARQPKATSTFNFLWFCSYFKMGHGVYFSAMVPGTSLGKLQNKISL